MSRKSLKACYKELKILSKCGCKKRRKSLLSRGGERLISAISDIAYNVLNGNFQIGEKSYKKLKRHKTALRILANKQKSNSSKIKLINNQVGGFLPALLIPVLSFVGQLIADKLSK